MALTGHKLFSDVATRGVQEKKNHFFLDSGILDPQNIGQYDNGIWEIFRKPKYIRVHYTLWGQ